MCKNIAFPQLHLQVVKIQRNLALAIDVDCVWNPTELFLLKFSNKIDLIQLIRQQKFFKKQNFLWDLNSMDSLR